MSIYSYKMLTAEEIRDFAQKGNTIAVLPLGSIEQHGRHLPVGTDLIIAEHLVSELMKTQCEFTDVLVLPPLTYSCSIEHNLHGGTLALESEQTIDLIIAIGEGLLRAGIRKMLILCCHGGNEFIMEVASRELRIKGMNSFCMHGSAGMSGQTDKNDMHAGEGETSMMMSFGEEYCRNNRINQECKKSLEKCEALINGSTRATQAWVIDDVAVEGVCGDPTLATIEKGQKFISMNVAEVVKVLQAIAEV